MDKAIDSARATCYRASVSSGRRRHFEEALTHSSYANEHRAQHVFGQPTARVPPVDAVLDLWRERAFARKSCTTPTKECCSRAYGALVNGESLARWARRKRRRPGALGRRPPRRASASAPTCSPTPVEALVAAIYLDEGLTGARRVASLIVAANLGDIAELSRRDAKTAFRSWCKPAAAPLPAYRLWRSRAPITIASFSSRSRSRASSSGRGAVATEKLAEQAAAATADCARQQRRNHPARHRERVTPPSPVPEARGSQLQRSWLHLVYLPAGLCPAPTGVNPEWGPTPPASGTTPIPSNGGRWASRKALGFRRASLGDPGRLR